MGQNFFVATLTLSDGNLLRYELNDCMIVVTIITCVVLCCLIQALYARECKRADQGAARMVPRLRECHILRDSWTKLNVSPAKIMQVTI